ncbi:hypothetical protein QSJ19_19095 [Gordonia sp. ABSL11-1]|uniref:hypothetical protein n=1 Tax=Gordonia sp. ABSL11-1 TaxID=3053924 RepID=UPI002573CD64|nr:hypothetical protein [Gordonia sp. ABSL11-1]MDL9947649.1 hypothetical protein [Gordonia sp. ABSL11-1]
MTAVPATFLDLPHAQAVLRDTPDRLTRNRFAGVVVLLIGLLLVVAPVFGGLFGDVAAGRQMLDQFGPHLQADKLAHYRDDVRLLRDAGSGLDAIYQRSDVAPGRFPAVDEYRRSAPAIADRADALLTRIESGVPDYQRLAGIGGFDRIPFLLVGVGLAALIASAAILGSAAGARRAVVAAAVAGLLLAAYPFAGGLARAGDSGDRMLHTLAPVMTAAQVRQSQSDFVVTVSALGVLDTEFRSVRREGADHGAVAALQAQWPRVSGDLADLVGTVNDNLDNFAALRSLNAVTAPVGAGGFRALPWALFATGVVLFVATLAAWPRRIVRERTGSDGGEK